MSPAPADISMRDGVRRDSDLLESIHRKVRDAQVERSKHEQQWDDNQRLAMGAHRKVFGHTNEKRPYCEADRIASIIGIQLAVMTETPPQPTFVPRESNEPPDWYLLPPGIQKIVTDPSQQGVGMLTPEQLMGREAIDDETAQQLLALTMPVPQQVDDGMGNAVSVVQQVALLAEGDMLAVTDELAAEALTQELASEWDKAYGDEFIRQHIFSTIVIGHRDAMFEWDADEYRGRLVDLYPFNVWWDRWSTTNGDAEYVIVRQVLPISEAKREFPDIPVEVLNDLTADPEATPFWGGMTGGKYQQSHDREVVDRWTMFQRNAMYDRDPEDAEAMGLIEPRMEQVPVETMDEQGFPTVSFVEQQATMEGEEGDEPQPLWTLIETGESTAPGMDNWPKRAGVYQVEMLGDVVLFEGETEFSDIPVARSKNYLIVDSPYGQGEPQRLAPLQEMYNRLWTLLREYAQFFAQPQKVAPVSVIQRMQEEVGRMWSSAKEVVGVPDDLIYAFQNIDNIIKTLDVPQLQPAFIEMLNILQREMDVIGGTAQVMRGDAKSEWSGETVKSLQSAARGPIGDKARSIGHTIRHIAKLWGNAIINYLPTQEWARRNRKYPEQILEAMRSRIKRVGFDVVAEVSGSGTKEAMRSNMIQLVQAAPTLTQSPTFLEKLLDTFDLGEAQKIVGEFQQLQMQSPPPAA